MKKTLEDYVAWCARRAVKRERPSIRAIVGSVGKSSTKEAIGVAVGAGEPGSPFRVSAKNYNNELGVPLTIFNRPAPGRSVIAWMSLLVRATLCALGISRIGAKILILEFGTDHPGDIAYLASIAPPEVAVVTAIGAEHTEFFGTVDAVAEEEMSVLRLLPAHGVAILNADDAHIMHAAAANDVSIVTFGESQDATVRLVSCALKIDSENVRASGLEISVVALGLAARLRLVGVFGKPHALAATAALAYVHAVDVDFHEAAERLKTYRGIPGRTQLLEGIKKTFLLDDSYNSSPLAALSAVRDLAAFPVNEGSKRIAALGDMLELGPLAEESHRDVGRAVAEVGIDMLVACGTLAHVVADGAKNAGMPEDRVFVFAKSPEAGLFIQEKLKAGDAVLIKGSQGARMEKITKELMAHPEHAKELLVRQTSDWE